ncbi:MAG: GGDEF domain-containing protein [Solirubrobacterales bacterium]|nr:GGDEF domain-containing protein [Solirubrobacterales bacterium]
MKSSEAKALIRLGHPRFRNFSDAAESTLNALADVIPGVIVLSQLEPEEQGCRVIDVRGAGMNGTHKGTVLPLGAPVGADYPPPGDAHEPLPDSGLDWDYLQSLGARACLEMPLEMSDGRIVGILSALDSRGDVYGCDHVAMLGVAARLLSYEWESVERRAELQRLRRRSAVSTTVDLETGLPNRDGFLDLLDHEWRLANRGTVESVLVVFRMGADPVQALDGDAMSKLAVKIAADVLEGNARATDRVGRVGEATVAAILVGCRTEHVPNFVGRFQAALRRVTEGRGPRIELSHGVHALAGTPSPEAVLKLTEAAAEASGQHQQSHAAHQELSR